MFNLVHCLLVLLEIFGALLEKAEIWIFGQRDLVFMLRDVHRGPLRGFGALLEYEFP